MRDMGEAASRLADLFAEGVVGAEENFDKLAQLTFDDAVEAEATTEAVTETAQETPAEAPATVEETAPDTTAVPEAPKKTPKKKKTVKKTVSKDVKEIAQKIMKGTTKSIGTLKWTLDVPGLYFVGNPFAAAAVDQATYDAAETNQTRHFSQQILDTLFPKDATLFEGTAYKYITSRGVKTILLDTGKARILVNEKFAKYFDGYNFYVTSDPRRAVSVYDDNFNYVGILMPTLDGGDISKVVVEKLDPANMKSFNKGTDAFSLRNIVDANGNDYGIGVYLDSTLLENLSDDERVEMLKLFVRDELAGNSFVAYDKNNNPIDISIARPEEKIYSGKHRRKVISELYNKNNAVQIKQESVVLADELVNAANYDKPSASKNSHDWLDNYGANDWEYWNTYIQEKNGAVWQATLNIANSADGRKILYDIDPIKKVAGAVKSAPTTTVVNNNTDLSKSQEAEAKKVEKIVEKANAQYDASTESAAPDVPSLRTWTESEFVQDRKAAAEALSESLGVSYRKALKYIDDINSVARLIADDRVRLDYDPNLDPNATVLKPNFNNDVNERILNDYKGGHRSFPVAQDVVDDFVAQYDTDSYSGGNVIPLSERFNTAKDDIRYSERDSSARYTDYDKPITQADVEKLRSIGKKSVNDFTSEDIQKAQKWAYKFYKELEEARPGNGVKSPFFRAWFGDWRANEKKELSLPNSSKKETYRAGKETNADTGKIISWGSTLKGETINHAVKEKVSIKALDSIGEIVKKAVLLDTIVSENSSKGKMKNTAFMHSFYTVYDGELIKLYVEEALSNDESSSFTRAYELKDIQKIADIPESVLHKKVGLTYETSATVKSISDLYALVKTYDKDFHAGEEVNPALLNEDGTPKVFYHGTDADFTVFDRTKGRSTMDIQGMFFSPWELDAQGYGSNVGAYYLSIKNPAPEGVAYRALNKFKGQNNAGVKAREYLESLGYDGVNNGDEEWIAFYPEQIKSATDNIGTFDSSNPDIRFSDRDPSFVGKRQLLATALESAAQARYFRYGHHSFIIDRPANIWYNISVPIGKITYKR